MHVLETVCESHSEIVDGSFFTLNSALSFEGALSFDGALLRQFNQRSHRLDLKVFVFVESMPLWYTSSDRKKVCCNSFH